MKLNHFNNILPQKQVLIQLIFFLHRKRVDGLFPFMETSFVLIILATGISFKGYWVGVEVFLPCPTMLLSSSHDLSMSLSI